MQCPYKVLYSNLGYICHLYICMYMHKYVNEALIWLQPLFKECLIDCDVVAAAVVAVVVVIVVVVEY